MKLLFARRPSLTLRFVLLSVLAIALMVYDQKTEQLSAWRKAVLWAVTPIEYLVDMPIRAIQQVFEHLQAKETLLVQNQQLKKTQLTLQARLQTFDALQLENLRLKSLLSAKKNWTVAVQPMMVAKLLQVNTDPFSQRIILNKGSQDGIKVGESVLDAFGVMGQVVEVSPYTSIVLLISDPSHAVSVQSNRSGTRAIAIGTGRTDILELNHVTPTADLEVGDTLVTSGLGERFAEGYPVGAIVSIEPDPSQSFMRVIVKPAAQLDKSREVVIVPTQEVETLE